LYWWGPTGECEWGQVFLAGPGCEGGIASKAASTTSSAFESPVLRAAQPQARPLCAVPKSRRGKTREQGREDKQLFGC